MSEDPKPAVSRESDKFMLRLPDGMRERIAEVAKANGRSMNAEIVARIEASLAAPAREALGGIGGKWSKFLTINLDDVVESAIREAVQNSVDASIKDPPPPTKQVRKKG
jgi:hypothetical protein